MLALVSSETMKKPRPEMAKSVADAVPEMTPCWLISWRGFDSTPPGL